MPEARVINHTKTLYYSTEYGTAPSHLVLSNNSHTFTASDLPTLVYDGMNFIGWYTTSTFDDGTMVSVGDTIYVSGDITLYAKWEEQDEVVFVNESSLKNIAKAIRSKNSSSNTYSPSEMAGAIEDISTGIELPTLTDPAITSEVFEDKEYIDSDGVKRTGTFTIDNEVTTQTDLITQITTALEGKAAGGGVELPNLTQPATGNQILQGYDAIDDSGNRIVGTIPNTEVDYYECPIDITTGTLYPLIAINQGGYVPDNYHFDFSYQLDTKAGTTITPSDVEQIAVPAGTYCTGDIKVAAASGGNEYEWTSLAFLPTTYSAEPTSIYYLEIPSGVNFVMFRESTPGKFSESSDAGFVYWQLSNPSAIKTFKTNCVMSGITCTDVSSGNDRILKIEAEYPDFIDYLLVKGS